MSRAAKGARLVWRDESRKTDGSLRNRAGWFIRDGSTFVSTGCGQGERERAEKALADFIISKYQPARERGRDTAGILIADVINVYLTDMAPRHTKPEETAARLTIILDFFGDKTLDDITGKLCRDFTASASTPSSARRQLEDLRSAINHYKREGYCTSAPSIVLPDKPAARERWLTRQEAARLLRAAWRMKQAWKGQSSDRRTGRHLARFILVALYTGTRSAAICGAAIRPKPGHGHVDLERGVFYRRATGARKTKKRQPPVPIPPRLLAHLRRWEHLGIAKDYVVEWNGKPVSSIKKSFRTARIAAGLDDDVTPHSFRHTAATWLMQSGTDLWQAAGFLGMTVETLEKNYGHHHPDHLADAARAMSTPQKPHRLSGTKRELKPSGVALMHENQ